MKILIYQIDYLILFFNFDYYSSVSSIIFILTNLGFYSFNLNIFSPSIGDQHLGLCGAKLKLFHYLKFYFILFLGGFIFNSSSFLKSVDLDYPHLSYFINYKLKFSVTVIYSLTSFLTDCLRSMLLLYSSSYFNKFSYS